MRSARNITGSWTWLLHWLSSGLGLLTQSAAKSRAPTPLARLEAPVRLPFWMECELDSLRDLGFLDDKPEQN